MEPHDRPFRPRAPRRRRIGARARARARARAGVGLACSDMQQFLPQKSFTKFVASSSCILGEPGGGGSRGCKDPSPGPVCTLSRVMFGSGKLALMECGNDIWITWSITGICLALGNDGACPSFQFWQIGRQIRCGGKLMLQCLQEVKRSGRVLPPPKLTLV